MRPLVRFSIFALTVAGVVMGAPTGGNAQEKYAGVPRDIDYLKDLGWTQVVLQGAPKDSLVAQSKNDRLLSILLVALSLKAEATVQWVPDGEKPKKLTYAKLTIKADEEEGRVSALSLDESDGYCRATIVSKGKKVEVWTKSASMQGILETAVRAAIPVQYLVYDAKTFEIARGKVNVELGK